MTTSARVRAAVEAVLRDVRADPAYARTSHLRVELAGLLVTDTRLGGPEVADVFSVGGDPRVSRRRSARARPAARQQ